MPRTIYALLVGIDTYPAPVNDYSGEATDPGCEPHGAVSYYLLDTLQRTNESLTYRDLFKRVNALVRARVAVQSPQLEATTTIDLDQPFLGENHCRGTVLFHVES